MLVFPCFAEGGNQCNVASNRCLKAQKTLQPYEEWLSLSGTTGRYMRCLTSFVEAKLTSFWFPQRTPFFVNRTPTAHTFFSCTLHRRVVRVCSRTLTPCACMTQRSTLSAFRPRTLIPHRALSYITSHLMTPTTTYPEPFLQRAQTLRRSTATAEWRSG